MQKLIWIGAPVLLGTLLMMGVLFSGSGSTQANELEAPEASPGQKRIYSYKLTESGKFQYPGSSVKEWQEFNGELFILDAESQLITSYGINGDAHEIFGIAGEAPWENRQVQHMWVDAEGIATVDNAHMVVKKSARDGTLLFYHKQTEPLWDGVYMSDERFFILDDVTEMPGFYTINGKTGVKGDHIPLASLIPQEVESDYLNIVFEGQVLRNDNNIVYMCSRTGYFITFNLHGEYQYTGRTIDRTRPPKVTARKTGNVTYFVREPDMNTNYSGAIDDTHLYILSLISWHQTSTLSIDMYRLADGKYTGSFDVPNIGNDLPVEILCGNERMHILYEGQQIVSYKLVPNEE